MRKSLQTMLLYKKTIDIIIPIRANLRLVRLISNDFGKSCTNLNVFVNKRFYSDKKVQNDISIKRKDTLHKLIAKSKLLTKLNKHPRFSNYFDKISEAGTVSTLTSFLILHELSAIVPLFFLWWVLYHSNIHDNLNLPEVLQNLMDYCSDVMNRFVGEKYPNLDRNKLIFTGALSYMTVKILYPLRILLSLWGAPYFGKWLILPFKKLQQLLIKK